MQAWSSAAEATHLAEQWIAHSGDVLREAVVEGDT